MTSLTALANASELSTTILYWVGSGVAYGTILALCTWMIVRLAGRKLGPALHGALWLVVLLKFVLPAGPGWSWSLSSLTHHAAERLHPVGDPRTAEASGWTQSAGAVEFVLLEEDGPGTTLAEPAGASLAVSPLHAQSPAVTWLALAYLVGVALTASVRLGQYLRFARHSRALPPADIETCIFVRDICRRIGVRRTPDVRLSGHAPAPYIMGMLRPMLVLSHRQMSDVHQLEAVVLHELAHLRRGDLLIRYLQWFAGTVLFFWPVVAWVNRRIDLMREHACDIWALRYGTLRPSEYARCLLGALEPVRSDRLRYCPAAMAANVKSVERRIDMILDAPPKTLSRRWLGVPVVALLAAWCGFALSGAASAIAPAEEVKEDADKDKTVKIVVKRVDDEGNVTVEETTEDIKFEGVDGAQHVIVRRSAGTPGAKAHAMFIAGDGMDPAKMHEFHLRTGLAGPEQLAKFMEAHPTADVDGDGNLTKVEHDAYLTARAMLAPEAVLTQFPRADLDNNGVLDGMEVARLVGGPASIIRHIARPLMIHAGGGEEGENVFITEVEGEDTDSPVIKIELKLDGDAGVEGEAVAVQTAAGEIVEEQVLELVPHFRRAAFVHESPGKWVLENIEGEPGTYDVSLYLETARRAPRAGILERHPEADTDGDGLLSDAEMKAFVHTLHGDANVWFGAHGASAGQLHKIVADHMVIDGKNAEPGEWVEAYTDEHGNQVKVVRSVTVDEDGKVQVRVEKSVGDDEGN